MTQILEVPTFFSHDADAIAKHLQSGKALCAVLNKDFPGKA